MQKDKKECQNCSEKGHCYDAAVIDSQYCNAIRPKKKDK